MVAQAILMDKLVLSTSLKEGIGIAYVSTQYAKVGTKLGMAIRNKILNCIGVDSPFYKEGTVNS